MSSDWLRHFELLKKNDCRYEVQIWYKCSLWGLAQMLLLFSWSEIQDDRHEHWLSHFELLFKNTESMKSKLGTLVPHEVPYMYCYFLSQPKILDGCNELWLAETFWNSSQECLNVWSPNFVHNYVPYEVLHKCCYFLSRSIIPNGQHDLWLAEIFRSFEERLEVWSPNLVQMFFMRSHRSVGTFWADHKPKMVIGT